MLTEIIRRTRRNHGLEHATIHVLSEKHKNFTAQGNSTPRGFHLNIYGDLSEADIAEAVAEAHERLRGGEHNLAVHPNCGTVLVTTATLTTLAATGMMALEQRREPEGQARSTTAFNALPGAMIAVLAALIVSRPLGVQLQARYTVDGQMRDLQVNNVQRVPPSLVGRLFHLLLAGGSKRLPQSSYMITTSGGAGV